MRFSIIGSRGIPAKYGGYEVFAEQLSIRLVKKKFSRQFVVSSIKKKLIIIRGYI